MRYAIGLTGGIGSGKSTIAEHFARRGITIVDADVAAHRLTAPGGIAVEAIRAAFGARFVRADGGLDRDAMRAHVFSDPAERMRLEAILHPLIRAEGERERACATSPYVMLVVPLLFEAGSRVSTVQRTLVVACDEAVQIERVMRRSGLSEPEVRAILAAQLSNAERVARADDVIDNSGTPDRLDEPIERLHRRYLEAAERFARS
jgi:dephospho-CoA kinase